MIAYTNMYIDCSISSVAPYMFRPPIVVIFREVLFEGYITLNIKFCSCNMLKLTSYLILLKETCMLSYSSYRNSLLLPIMPINTGTKNASAR